MDATCLVPGNRRGGSVLLHRGFRYRRRNKTTNKIYWECTEIGCGAKLHTNVFEAEDDIFVISSGEHDHLANEDLAHRGLILKKMHILIRNDPTKTPRRVFESATRDMPEEHMPRYLSLRSRAQRFRSSIMSPCSADDGDEDVNVEDVNDENVNVRDVNVKDVNVRDVNDEYVKEKDANDVYVKEEDVNDEYVEVEDVNEE